ncbi:unnamed protein product [marine sediment metagenome]|uniref:Uncharacterized protein n=1 Tax=marine sediment metagenome TaxID=412755 RepID=X0S3F1_9ZZZZ
MGANNILTINSTAHGKSAGSSVVITGGVIHTVINLATIVDDTVMFQTATDHDKIKPTQALDDKTLTLGGFADSAWNDEHIILDVPNRRNFIVDGNTTISGGEYLVENLAKGVYTIVSATTDSFTIDLSAYPAMPTGTVYSVEAISGFRIYAAADFNRAKDIYTKMETGEACVFVIMTDGEVSRDEHNMNDAIAGFTKQDLHVLRIQRNFSTVVFLPTHDDLSGVDAQDLCYGSIYTSLLYTLFGFEEYGMAISYSAVPTGDGPSEYNSAWYAHVYDWQLPTVLTLEDGFLQPNDVAFRDIEQTLKLFNDDVALMTSDINLDEEPV